MTEPRPGRRRVVVTGVGVVAANGIGREAFWDGLIHGRPTVRKISLFKEFEFRSQIGAEVPDWDPIAQGLSPAEARRMDRYVQFAAVCAREAVADSGLDLDAVDHDRLGVAMGSAVGGTTLLEQEYVLASDRGKAWLVESGYVGRPLYQALMPSSLASEIAVAYGAHALSMTVSNGCTAGIDAVAFGYETILDGEADVMLAGAAESPVSPISLACFDPIKATSRRNDDPARASRPFDRDRDGFTIGEGAAVLVLEELEHARRRGARVYAEVLGYAGVCNAYHMTGLESHGRDMAKAIRLALDQAGLEPEAIGYINAHGSSTAQNDLHETAAFKEALGDHAYRVPISSIKSMIGHSLGAIGAIEMACCALVIDRGILPPTINYENPDPLCDLDYVPNVAREQRVDVVLSTGSGFGGFQSAMLFGRPGVGR